MTGPQRIARLRRLARDLTPLRVGATLVQLLPSAVLEVSGDGRRRAVGASPAADLGPCQARGMVAAALSDIDVSGLTESLGLDPRRASYRLVTGAPVCDRGGGVFEVTRGAARQLVFATVLGPDRVAAVLDGCHSRPEQPLVCRHDTSTGVSVAGLEHDDEARRQDYRGQVIAAAAACYAAELIAGLPACDGPGC